MNSRFKSARCARRRLRIALPALLLISAAWASTPAPTAQLQAAQQAIASAERVDAATNAGVELGEARAKLASAQRAVDEKKMVVAQRFADEARASAELASAKSGLAKANAANKDLKDSTATLIEEMQRKSGDSR